MKEPYKWSWTWIWLKVCFVPTSIKDHCNVFNFCNETESQIAHGQQNNTLSCESHLPATAGKVQSRARRNFKKNTQRGFCLTTRLFYRQLWWGSVQTGQHYLKEKSFALHVWHTGVGEHIALHPVWIFQEHFSTTKEKCYSATENIHGSSFSKSFRGKLKIVNSHLAWILFMLNFRIRVSIQVVSQHWCH